MNNNYSKSESLIEKELLIQLELMGWTNRTDIKNISDIELNIKLCLEKVNNLKISEEDFNNFLKETKNYTTFEAAQKLRDKIVIKKNEENDRYNPIDIKNFNKNIFEFSRQITHPGEWISRGDVTLFINGFPIVQIELKKCGIQITEAFNQCLKYKIQSFDNNIFKFIQIFVISNFHETIYFSNNKINDMQKNTLFNWRDSENKVVGNLVDFTEDFFEKENLFKIITKYTVLNQEKKAIVLRPYQYYAIEKILIFLEETQELNNNLIDLEQRAKKLNCFVWHATGSGKTLTSFKLCEILKQNEKYAKKIVFLVDRLDLNAQTIKEFKTFSGSDLQETENTKKLGKQLKDPTCKLIVSTIQKLDRLMKSKNFKSEYKITEEDIIFIIDECHRTQFGDMHKRLRKSFIKSRLIGFTGTPIFEKNSKNEQTTGDIFGINIHKYMMNDAIKDKNVLAFNIEYRGKLKNLNREDKEVDSIDKKEYFESDKYISKLVQSIYDINDRKTNNRSFKSMIVTSSIKNAISIYNKFRNEYPGIKAATLFSPSDNNKANISNGEQVTNHQLKDVLNSFNKDFKQNYDINTFKNYSNWIQADLKKANGQINIIIVVRMLTTGFDCKFLNTIYLDKRLQDSELIQTISRANRTGPGNKLEANIIAIRTSKDDVDEACALYSSGDGEDYLSKWKLKDIYEILNSLMSSLLKEWPKVNDVLNISSEKEKVNFVKIMKKINRNVQLAETYIDFDWNDLLITKDEFFGYQSKQRDLYHEIQNGLKKESILNDIDFEFEFISQDLITYDYLFELLDNMKKIKDENFGNKIDEFIKKVYQREPKSKAKLIEDFIDYWKNKMNDIEGSEKVYYEWRDKRFIKSIENFAISNNLDLHKFEELIKKQENEKKTIDNYRSEIRKLLLNNLTTEKREILINKIMKFLTELNEIKA